MKKWFTLIGLCCLMTGMISATNQPLKRISPVQAAQMRLGVLNEGTTRMEGTVRPGDTKNIGRILSRSAVSSVTANSSAFRNAVSADSWLADGNYDISWYDETKDEFSLSSPAQLAGLSYLVRAGKNFQYCTVRLSADIDLSNYKWIPIGTRGVEFKGLFDGGGHTISGLHTDMEAFSGLFGAVASTDIRNVMLSSSCVVVGSVAGSIAGSMNESAIMNCRSDAAVQGYTAGGLVGNADNSSVLASIFNGRVSKLEAANAWVGSYTVTAGSPFEGEGTQSFEVTIEADDSSPERLTIGWSSSRYGIVYTLTGFIEDDGCLHISIGEQQLGSYGAYTMMLVRYTDDGIFASGEVVGSLSDDNNTITFSVSPASYLMIAAVENDQVAGWLEGYIPPFTAVKNEAQIMTGGIVGTSYNTFLEKCFYGDGCAGDGYNDIGTALPSDELLSDAQVRTMNSAASGIVLSDPFVSSLKMWRPGENGPALIEEDYVQSNWWTSEGNYDVSWYDESRTEFTISSPEQLAGLAYLVNTCHQFWGKTVILANDIDLAEHLWVPIGRNSRNAQSVAIFGGTFDGGGYVIRNLNISMKAYSYAQGSTTCLVGFFGYSSGVIENVTLAEDCAVRVTATGSQYLNVGSICGVLGGNYIANCHNRAYIEVRSLFGNIFAAGILGFDNSYNPVYNCSNANDVVGFSTWGIVCVSGLVAANAKVVNGYNTGNISGTGPSVEVGGITPSFAQLNNVYNTGRLTATGRSIIPESEPVATASPIVASYGASVENGYYDIACVEDTTGMNVKGTAMTADEMKSFAFAELLTSHAASLVESDPDLPEMLSWTIRSEENDGFPVFGEAVEAGGWWTSAGNYDISWYDEAEDSFSISTPAQLAGVAYLVKTGRTFEGKTVTLSGNIDLDGLKWEPIGKANLQQIFKGVFDGGGYEIHNLRSEVISTGEAYSGLFGAIYQARVTRVVLAEDCEIRTSYYGGGVVAYAQESEIVSCENRASVSFEGPAGYVGGIAGYVSTSSIDRCENLGVVTGTVQPSDNYASCLVYTGGIAGVNQGATIINNSNHAAVAVEALPEYDSCAGGIVGYNSGSSVAFIANCYNAAGVRLSGAGFAGGILSYTDNGDVRVANCYNVGTVSGVPGKSYPIVPILSADSEDCYYLMNCVEGEGSYAGTALTVDYMKSTAFAARLNDWSKTNNSSETGRQTLYWKVEDAENDGYPVFTDQDPGYTGVESVVSGVRIYPTTVSGELFVCGAESPIYICNLAGHIVSIIDPTEEITVVDISRLVAGVYLVRTGDKVVRLVKL
ncbi:T9SS type A sorting domain-containing protein [Barnesiella intestinihominis]|uniref:T9SS type A sorting domain-containing protein n=2 Tax=Barnesiella intestinihominis TaxID=487174 RepID=UPI0039949C63